MNRPLFPHCQTAEKSSRLRGRNMTSVREPLSTTSSHVSCSTRLPAIRRGSLLTCTCTAWPESWEGAFRAAATVCSVRLLGFTVGLAWSRFRSGVIQLRGFARVRKDRLLAAPALQLHALRLPAASPQAYIGLVVVDHFFTTRFQVYRGDDQVIPSRSTLFTRLRPPNSFTFLLK